MKKIKKNSGALFSIGFLALLVIGGVNCNWIDDGVSYSGNFNYSRTPNNLGSEVRTIFNFENDINFAGITKVKTSFIDGEDTITDGLKEDSVFFKIGAKRDTILTRDGSVIGEPYLLIADTSDWSTFVTFMGHENGVMRKIIEDQLDTAEYNAIIEEISEYREITSEQKETVVEVINRAILDLNFYSLYGELFDLSLAYRERVEDLVVQGIFSDTSGTVSQGLNPFEKAKLQWFNLDLFREFVDYGMRRTPGTPLRKVFSDNLAVYQIYSVEFEQYTQNDLIPPKKATRYLGINSFTQMQFAYRNNTGLRFTKETKLADKVFFEGKAWSVTPMLFSENYFLPNIELCNYTVATQAVTFKNRELSSRKNSLVYDLTMYYPIQGSTFENGEIVEFKGKIEQTYTFRISPLVSQMGIMERFNSATVIQKTYPDGTVAVYEETIETEAVN
ncbi:hypothetical protein CHISP_0513 [Chitinispirillum alkaliphilum]|nr:hypothetical protein CHISP_0513 [Chitinispirillum alkaliphilum]